MTEGDIAFARVILAVDPWRFHDAGDVDRALRILDEYAKYLVAKRESEDETLTDAEYADYCAIAEQESTLHSVRSSLAPDEDDEDDEDDDEEE